MLELAQIINEIDALTAETGERIQRVSEQMERALTQARMDPAAWREQMGRIENAKTRWLVALPLSEAPVATALGQPPLPSRYSALATDGSQIPLDRHELAPCYVLNIGEIALHYGAPERSRLASRATLHYKEDDILLSGAEGEQAYVTDREISTRRTLAEARALGELIAQNSARENGIAIYDGTLILWSQEAEPDRDEKRVIGDFCAFLRLAQEARVPVASYLSSPGSREVVNALRISLCPDDNPCPHKTGDWPCLSINRVSDAALFAMLLSPGERSPLFASQSRVLNFYEPEDQRIAFYYLHAGAEIVRVETPLWVARDESLVARTHALILDQVKKGNGYPVCLMEAHEQAVVRGPEREAFFRLVQNSFVRNDVPVRITRKAVAKRTRIL
jgi:hypothetical protein